MLLNKQEKIIYWLLFCCGSIGLFLQAVNKVTLNFPVSANPIKNSYLLVLFCIPVLMAAHFIKSIMPRSFLTLFSFFIIILAAITTSWLIIGVQSTPFPLIDKTLLAIDEFLYFYTIPIMTWTYQNKFLYQLLVFSYAFVIYLLLGTPILLGILKKEKCVYEFFLFFVSTFLFSCLIYYLFPANGPYTELKSPLFPYLSTRVVEQFSEIHNYISPPGSFLAIISFPSLHIFWVLTILYSIRKIKWLFIPSFFIGIAGGAATVLLGWHYLIEVLITCLVFFVIFVPFVNRCVNSS